MPSVQHSISDFSFFIQPPKSPPCLRATHTLFRSFQAQSQKFSGLAPRSTMNSCPSANCGQGDVGRQYSSTRSWLNVLFSTVILSFDISIRDPFQLENDRPDAIAATCDDGVPIFCLRVVPPVHQGHHRLVDVVPGPITKALSWVGVYDELLSLDKIGAE